VASENELSPDMKIFTWRGRTARPPAASVAPDIVPIVTETGGPAVTFGDSAMNLHAFPNDFIKTTAAGLLTPGPVPTVTEAMPPVLQSQSVLKTGLGEAIVGVGLGAEECADYTLRMWKDGELAKHVTTRLTGASALQFMYSFAAGFPSGSDVRLYAGLHERQANIPIKKLISEVRVPFSSDCRAQL
jgi:hypothetical protein